MVDELDILRRLSSAAGAAGPPRVDVTAGVLRRITARRERTCPVLGISAVVSAAAAAVCLATAYVGTVGPDPLGDMLNALAMVIP